MTRVAPVLVLVVMMALSLTIAPALAQEVLTNDSVVQMIKAGLPESVVIAKIRSTATKFDLRTESLVSLKKSGVSDKVLEAMMTPGPAAGAAPTVKAPAAGAQAAAPTPAATTPAGGSLRDRDAIYQLIDGKYVELFPTSANLETNVAFFQSKSEVVLEGRKAKYRTADKQPVFLSTYGPTDAPLVRLKPGDSNDDRNLKISSGAFMPFGGTQKMGVRNEDKIATNVERDAGGFYRVTPAAPLPPGEYGFILASGFGAGVGRIFDFGVD
jgi:hypothetical protein